MGARQILAAGTTAEITLYYVQLVVVVQFWKLLWWRKRQTSVC